MSEITKNLSSEQIQNFDIDSIKEMIDAFESKKEQSTIFDIDGNEKLSIKEIEIREKLKDSENILEWLKELLIAVEKETTIWSTMEKNIWNVWENITDSIKKIKKEHITAIAEELMQEWNIPDTETIISVLDKIQYIATWEEDKKIWELIEKLKNWTEWDWNLRLEASQVIWLYTWFAWTSVYNKVQEEIIQWILWNNEWFNQEFLMWYDSKKWWNFLLSIKEFENDIKSKTIDKWNPEAWSNYIKYLISTWKRDQESLLKKFWAEKLNELSKYWEKNPNAIGKKLIEKDIVEKVNEDKESKTITTWKNKPFISKNWIKLPDIWNWNVVSWIEMLDTMQVIENFSALFDNINENFDKIFFSFNTFSEKDPKIREQLQLNNKKNKNDAIKILENDPNKLKQFNKKTNINFWVNTCPGDEYAKELIDKARKIEFKNQIDKLNINEYKYWNETASEHLKKLTELDFCAFNTIDSLQNFKNDAWESIDSEKLTEILWTYLSIKKEVIKQELSIVLWDKWLNSYSSIKDPFEQKIFLEKKLEEEKDENNKKILKKAIESLGKIWNTEAAWLEKSVDNIVEANGDINIFKKLNYNDWAAQSVDNYLRQNEKKFLKVINDLNLYWVKITDIEMIIESKPFLYKELLKHKNLNNDWKELLAIMSQIIKLENDNFKLKWEEYKIVIDTKEIEKNENTYYNLKTNTDNEYVKNNIFNSKDYSFNSKEWTFKVDWTAESIELNPIEKKLVENNPDTLNNIVDFYKTLDKVWLSKFWKIKDRLFTSISNVKWIWFKIDEDYLNKNETKIFLNSILKSIWEEEISPIFTLKSFLAKIEIKNKTQLWWWEAVVNTHYEETYLENKFYNKFVNRNSWLRSFDQEKFEKSLKTKQQKKS